MFNPWYKTSLTFSPFGQRLKFLVPHDLFSTQRIDEGTELLLSHLPQAAPFSVLDMGCGYGALSLPLALKYPNAQFTLVDRDLLAVEWSRLNALENRLENVQTHGSLGFRDIRDSQFDWILCNVPARIGKLFIENLISEGQKRLNPLGEMRIVVIRDLVPLIDEISNKFSHHNASCIRQVAQGPRHTVFSVSKLPEIKNIPNEDHYLRDQVQFDSLFFDRPFDLGGDDPKRLKFALPILVDALPKSEPQNVLCVRCGYGILPLFCRRRWPKASITASDRDLLATTFTLRNEKRLKLVGPSLQVVSSEKSMQEIDPKSQFDLVIGELSASAGEKIAESDLTSFSEILTPKGEALILVLEKHEKQWITPIVEKRKLKIYPVLRREGYTLLRLIK